MLLTIAKSYLTRTLGLVFLLVAGLSNNGLSQGNDDIDELKMLVDRFLPWTIGRQDDYDNIALKFLPINEKHKSDLIGLYVSAKVSINELKKINQSSVVYQLRLRGGLNLTREKDYFLRFKGQGKLHDKYWKDFTSTYRPSLWGSVLTHEFFPRLTNAYLGATPEVEQEIEKRLQELQQVKIVAVAFEHPPILMGENTWKLVEPYLQKLDVNDVNALLEAAKNYFTSLGDFLSSIDQLLFTVEGG